MNPHRENIKIKDFFKEWHPKFFDESTENGDGNSANFSLSL